MRKKWTKEEDNILIENYNKIPVNKLGLNRTLSSIRSRVIKLGITDCRNKYNVNDLYFTIPTIENCYYAGLIASDGHIIKNSIGQKSLNITSTDKHILESFKKDIKYTGQIHQLKKVKLHHKIKYRITITNDSLCDALYNNWNITPKKSLTLLPPDFTDRKLIMAYIKGFMDGDGGVYNRNGLLGLGFTCASLDFIMWIKYTLNTPNKIQTKSGIRKHKCYDIHIVGQNAKVILDEIYGIDTPYLFRKKEIYNGMS